MEVNRKLGKIFKKILTVSLIILSSCATIPQKQLPDAPPPDMLLLMEARNCLDAGELATAEDYIKKFIALYPSHANYPYVLYLRADISFKRGNYLTAYQLYKMARKLVRDPQLIKKIEKRMKTIEIILKLKFYAFSIP